jgi:sigma-B regulation protein RsbU (phosphoserine phosphatase)
LNRLLVDDFPSGRFVTLVYGVLDPAKRTLTFANAGHLKPLLANEGSARFLESQEGLPLGLGFGQFSETQVALPEGSRVLFYSDGITEAANPSDDEYGLARLQEQLLDPQSSTQSILENVRSFANGADLRDDATVILVKA